MPIQERLVWEGTEQIENCIKVSPQNRAIRYGDGIFETVLVRNGEPVALQLHLERFLKGTSVLGFAQERLILEKEFYGLVGKLLKGQGSDGFGRMRITAYRADGGHFLATDDNALLHGQIQPLPADPWHLKPPKVVHIVTGFYPPMGHLMGTKSLNALPYVLASKEASKNRCEDAILVSDAGEVLELTNGNLFMVKDGRLCTPPLESGCLPGTMRIRILQAAAELEMTVDESPIAVKSLAQATETFHSNAIQGIQPILGRHQLQEDLSPFTVMLQLRRHLKMLD